MGCSKIYGIDIVWDFVKLLYCFSKICYYIWGIFITLRLYKSLS